MSSGNEAVSRRFLFVAQHPTLSKQSQRLYTRMVSCALHINSECLVNQRFKKIVARKNMPLEIWPKINCIFKKDAALSEMT